LASAATRRGAAARWVALALDARVVAGFVVFVLFVAFFVVFFVAFLVFLGAAFLWFLAFGDLFGDGRRTRRPVGRLFRAVARRAFARPATFRRRDLLAFLAAITAPPSGRLTFGP